MYCNFSGPKMGHFDPFWSILIHFWGSNLDPPFSLICVVNTGPKRTQIWFILEVLFHHIYRTGHWTCFKKWVISWNLEYFWIFLDIFGYFWIFLDQVRPKTEKWHWRLSTKGTPNLGHFWVIPDSLPIHYHFIYMTLSDINLYF